MMSENFDLRAELAEFSGSAALFPLPNAVFFPRTLFPLHIFEPRYRRMTADALEENRLIAMALLRPGWEMLPDGQVPPIYETVCLSKIAAEEKLPDGGYYLVMQGLCRARIVAETEGDLPYRIGELELCPDEEISAGPEEQILREELLRSLQSLQPGLAVSSMFAPALDAELPLGAFCDVLAHALRLPPGDCQSILEEQNISRRGRLVLKAIRAAARQREIVPAHFPPKFSRN